MKGLNIGNGLDAPREGEWGVYVRRAHFEMAKEGGFDHVRLPVRFSAHTLDHPPYTIDPDLFERVDWAIDQATKRGLGIVIDLHHFAEIMKNPDSEREKLLAMWGQIAERYRNRPRNVAFELLNEPMDRLEPAKLSALMNDTLKVVRKTNPDRLVIVDSYFWAAAEHLVSLDLPKDDKNVIGSFHCYTPILFTHQGSQFMDPEYKTSGIPFPGPPAQPVKPVAAAERKEWVRQWFVAYNQPVEAGETPPSVKEILKVFEQAGDFVRASGHRLYLGEFGVIDSADMPSRERYLRFVREEAERRGIGWAVWDDGGAMKIMDVFDGTFNELLREALMK